MVSSEVCYAEIGLGKGKTCWIPTDPGCATNLQLPGINVNNPIIPDSQDTQETENGTLVTSEKMGEEIYHVYEKKKGGGK